MAIVKLQLVCIYNYCGSGTSSINRSWYKKLLYFHLLSYYHYVPNVFLQFELK